MTGILNTDFYQKLILTILDKGALALVVLVFGYWFNKRLENYRADQQRILALQKEKSDLENEIYKQKRALQLQFKEKQLSSFYWPIFLRLQKDSAMWKVFPQLYEQKQSLPEGLARNLELSFLIKNHEETVSIIEGNVHLAEADADLLADLVSYIKHVAVYKALRNAGIYDSNPIDYGEPFPKHLEERIRTRQEFLQAEYERLVKLHEDR